MTTVMDLQPRIFVSGATKSQIISFAIGQALMVCLIIALYIYRMKTLQLLRFTGAGLSFSRILLNLVYLCGLCFAVSAFLLTLISGIKSDDLCDTAIQLCLVFYLGGKAILYMFMCERLRAIRQGIVDRCADILWQRCFFGILSTFGQLMIICFYYDLDNMRDGYCTIGLPVFITIPLLLFDVGCNLAISTIFYKQSRLLFKGVTNVHIPPEIRRFFYPRTVKVDGIRAFAIAKPLSEMPKTDNATIMMAEIIRKTLLVSITIFFSTTANLILLVIYNGTERGWLVFPMCYLDVTWNLSCLTYLIGLPTNHETPNEINYNDREDQFRASQLHLLSDVPPSQVVDRTAAWVAFGSASGVQKARKSYEVDDLRAPGPVLRR